MVKYYCNRKWESAMDKVDAGKGRRKSNFGYYYGTIKKD